MERVDEMVALRASKITGNEPLINCHVQLKAIITDVHTDHQRQVINQKGYTAVKNKQRKDLENIVFKVANGTHAYAVVQKDLKLIALSTVTRSYLNRCRESDLVAEAKTIRDAAAPLAESLVAQGITADDLTALDKGIESFPLQEPGRGALRAFKKQATVDLALKVKEGMDLLHNEMDVLMLPYLSSDPTFYGEYKNARIIVDVSGGQSDQKKEPEK